VTDVYEVPPSPPNAAPSITSPESAAVPENTTFVLKVNGTDPDGDQLSYAIPYGDDKESFDLNATTGVLTFRVEPDFEQPEDADADNVYEVSVEVSDGEFTAFRNLAITVLNVPENQSPAFGEANATFTMMENNASSFFAHAHDPDANASLFYSITGPDAGLFQINELTGELSFKHPPDYEYPNDLDQDGAYEVTIMVSDGFASSAQNLTVQVNDNLAEDSDGDGFSDGEELAAGTQPANPDSMPNRPPEYLILENEFVDESQPAGAVVGNLYTFDPDHNDTLTYSLAEGPGDYDNAAFQVNGNILETAVFLDYETKYLYYVRLAVDDGRGGRIEETFTVQVRNVFIPIARTMPRGEVTHDHADLSGQLLADGFSPVTEMGIIVSRSWWFPESDPNTRRIAANGESDHFQVEVDGLEPATRYYFRAYAINGEGTALGAKKRFNTQRAPKTDPWENAEPIGDGWFHLPWFGTFRPFENNWIYHQDLGWMHVKGTDEDSIWLWNADWGWLWTSSEVFPHVHSHADQSWLYFLSKDASGKPVFYHYGARQWLNVAP